jgi:hypothetical protein
MEARNRATASQLVETEPVVVKTTSRHLWRGAGIGAAGGALSDLLHTIIDSFRADEFLYLTEWLLVTLAGAGVGTAWFGSRYLINKFGFFTKENARGVKDWPADLSEVRCTGSAILRRSVSEPFVNGQLYLTAKQLVLVQRPGQLFREPRKSFSLSEIENVYWKPSYLRPIDVLVVQVPHTFKNLRLKKIKFQVENGRLWKEEIEKQISMLNER